MYYWSYSEPIMKQMQVGRLPGEVWPPRQEEEEIKKKETVSTSGRLNGYW